MQGRALFEKVVELSGLAGLVGGGLVRRALADAGAVAPDEATADDYEAALPRLRERLRTYLAREEADRRVRRIAGLLAHTRGDLESDDEDDWSTFGRVVEVLREVNAPIEEPEGARSERDELLQTGARRKDGAPVDDDGRDSDVG